MEKMYEVVRIEQIVSEVKEEGVTGHITSTVAGAEVARHFIGRDDREVFLVITLNVKNNVNSVHRCHVGSLDNSIVHPREVYKTAILSNSARIIVAHQHPSGDLTPSNADIQVTQRLQIAGDILGIELLDHIIVNMKGDYYSMREEGDID